MAENEESCCIFGRMYCELKFKLPQYDSYVNKLNEMISFLRTSLSWLCVLMVLLTGPLQAHGLVLCIEGDGTKNIEFKVGEDECSCPLVHSNDGNSSVRFEQGEECGCTDVELLSAEQVYKQSTVEKLQQVSLDFVPVLVNFFTAPSVPSYTPQLFDIDVPSSSSYISRSVILLI